mgnify:CR=1 FL=1
MNAKKINNNFEPYKRVVKFVGSAIIVLLELAAYYYVWMDCYNRNMTVAARKLADRRRISDPVSGVAPAVRRSEGRDL